ncbi:hypothetical protein [Chryseolinea sp. H1M3-3]|uniref:hypothetical protein n=1 Tax=Chryseolinea sp. H1M3-3 TaxID=3034144 RepID=UPI0023EB71A7|nr:hypothetical protein [Chryseolinea sp. H1M3-3]
MLLQSRPLAWWVFFLLLPGCSGYQYVASPRYLPSNEKKGNLTANVYLSGAQIGYAFSNNFSVFTTGYMRYKTVGAVNPFIGTEGTDDRSGDSREINLGLSYFGNKNKFLYEVLVGGGFGDMTFRNDHHGAKNRDLDYLFEMQADRSNIFIQPNLSYKLFNNAKKFKITVAAFTKFNKVYYHNIKTQTVSGFPTNPTKPDFDSGIEYFSARQQAHLFFIEPGVHVNIGWKTFRGIAQIAPVINASGHALHYQMISINAGLSMSLNLLKKKNSLE